MRFLKWLIGLLIILGLLLTLAPFAAKWYVLNWFEDKGYQAQIKHLGLDFIFGEIALYDVHVSNANEEGFSLFSADIDLDLLALLKGRVVIDKATIDSARLDLRKVDDTWLLAGFRGGEWRLKTRDGAVSIRSASFVNTELCSDYQSRCLRLESTKLTDARLVQQQDGWLFSHSGPVLVQKAFLRDRAESTTLFYGGELNIERGSYTINAVDMTGMRLANIQFIENELEGGGAAAPYQTQIGELLISALYWQQEADVLTLELGTVNATSVRQALQKNKLGGLLLPLRIRSWLKNLQVKGGQGLRFRLEALQARDGAIAWADYSVSPPATEKFSAVMLQLGAIDSAFANTPTAFSVSGKLGRNGALRFEGNVYPYRERLSFDIKGLVESLNVANFASYTHSLLGQRVDDGEVDVALDAIANDGYLRAQTRWQWTGFDIAPARSPTPYMPLELAYDLLKDHNDSVRFTLEITGEIGSETVQPKYVLSTQARRTLSKMANGEMMSTGGVSVSTDRQQQQLSFEPLHYSANARYPVPLDQQRVTEIARMLKDKSHLKMRFCPVTTGGEWAQVFNQGQSPAADDRPRPEQVKQLLDLAGARGQALKSALMEAGAAADQVLVCAPRVDMTQSGLSFVSVTL